MAQSYRDLSLWQKAMVLAKEVQPLTRQFLREELFVLTSQRRRATLSVPCNIAGGQAHLSAKEFRHFLSHARGSLVEVETQLLFAQELGYVRKDKAAQLLRSAASAGQMLNGLSASIREGRTHTPHDGPSSSHGTEY